MPFTAHFFCSYLTSMDSPWRGEDYSASQFTKAIKGRPFNGYAQVPVPGGIERIAQEDTGKAVGIFAAWAARVVQSNLPAGNIALVPIPSSSAVVGTPSAGPPGAMALSLALRLGRTHVADVLRWTEAMQSSSQGGPRDAQTLFEKLAVTGPVRASHVVLVDDVCTSQGHIRAAATRLTTSAQVRVSLAVCAGRTNQVQVDNPFELEPEEVPDFVPMRRLFGPRAR